MIRYHLYDMISVIRYHWISANAKMKGKGTSVAPVYAGLRADTENLLKKFIDTRCNRYETFLRCFHEMNFSMIYMGREYENELREVRYCAIVAQLLARTFPDFSVRRKNIGVGAIVLLTTTHVSRSIRRCVFDVRSLLFAAVRRIQNESKK